MRFVPVTCVREGSKLAKHVYDSDGRILLKSGASVTKRTLRRIKEMGISSIYVDDEYSDVELEDIIKPELRNQAIVTAKNTFKHFGKFSKLMSDNPIKNKHQVKRMNEERDDHIKNLAEISESIIDEILTNKNLMINLVVIKSLDDYTYQHCINVAILSLVLGVELNLNKGELKDVCLGAMLHDIGKTLVPNEILQKKGPLTKEEFDVVKQHTVKGYEFLRDSFDISGPARIIALQHHEKADGTGYPNGLKESEINRFAKIVAVADVYDALTSDRSYRQALPPNEALEYIYANGQSHFDYELVKAFSTKIVPYPIGTLVKLSNGDIGVVEDFVHRFALRPQVKIIARSNGEILEKGETVDLLKEKSIVITNIQYEDPRQLADETS